MELRQLRIFVALAASLHFGRTADALGLAQPAVSQALRRLETVLATPLFVRSSHHVALTPAGELLLPHARDAVDAADRLRRVAAEWAGGQRPALRIATTPGIGPRLGAVIGRFAAAHPEIALELPALDTAHKLQALREGRLDVAFLRSPPPDDADLAHTLAWRERVVAVVPHDHGAGATDPVDIEALADLPMLIIDRAAHPAMHDQLLALCATIGLTPRLGPSVRTLQDTIAMVASGSAWTLYIDGNLSADTPGVTVRRLPPPEPRSDVWVVWPATAAPQPTRDFIATIRGTRQRKASQAQAPQRPAE